MKKLLVVAMAAMTLVSASFAKTIVLDMAESANGPVAQIEKNQYADNYQCTSLTQADFSKQLKGGLPEVGDIVQIHYKFTADVDLDTVDFYLVDTSAAAVTQVWKYIGELIFNMLVLVGTIKISDRIVREMMGL